MEVMDVTPTRLVRTPHPLTTQGQTSLAVLQEDGETLLSLLQRHNVDSTWVVEVGGLQVPAILWGRVRVHHGQVIECRAAVQKDVVKIIAFAALAYFTMGGGAGWIAKTFGVAAGGFAASMIGAVAFAAGAMVINRILPPPKAPSMDVASNSVEPTYSLSGGRNSQRLWQPMSLVLGQPYAVFDLAAQPYSYFGGEDQYLQQIFHLGINCQRVDTLRIGQTALSNFEGVSIAATGLPGNGYSTAMPSNNVDSIPGALLDAPSGTGPWVTRTTSPGTAQICIDIEANLYGTNSSTGAWEQRQCDLEVQYAVAGSGNWVGVSTGSTRLAKPAGTAWLFNSTAKPLRRTFTVAVASGQYDVRLRKITANNTSTSGQNVVQWIQLRSFQAQTTSFPGQALLAVNIKASGQLSGAIDELNGILTAKPCPHWNGSAWVTATNRGDGLSNPGTIMLAYARGFYDENGRLMAGLGWPDSRIDLDSIKAFTVWCTARGFTFDAHIQDAMSHGDLLDAVAYAGMGSVCMPDGKLGVQWLADDAPVEGVINMGNIKAKSFSVQYDLNDRADEIEYGYFDRNQGNQWNALRVLAPGVTMPRSTARLSNLGITSQAHAAVLARHSMAQNIYMAKAITFEQDLEHLTYRRGTVLSLSHDMTQWGYSGRVQSVTDTGGVITLGLDDAVPATGPGGASNKFIGLRLLGEAQYRIFQVQAFTGTARSVTLVGAWPAGVPLPGVNGQVHDALWVFDFKATPGLRVVVSKVEPMGGMTGAQVTVVPLPEEFWPFVNSGAYTPPPNRSLLSVTPAISNLRVNEVLRRQGNTWYTDLSVDFDSVAATSNVQVWGARGDAPLELLGTTTSRSFSWMGGLSETWALELRPFSSLGMRGTVQRIGYTVQGLSVPPPDVQVFTIDGSVLGWTPVEAIDLAGYRIRFHYGQNTWWPTAADLHDGLITEMPYTLVNRPTGTVTLLIKAVDTTGNESVNAAVITVSLGDALVDNIVNTWPQHTTWPGIKTNASVVGGQLLANAVDVFYDADEEPFFGMATDPFYALSQSQSMRYEWDVISNGPGRLTLSHSIVASSYTIEYARDNAEPFYGLGGEFFYGSDVEPFYSQPQDWAVWPGYANAVNGELFLFRITTAGGTGVEAMQTLQINLDVPDITVSINDLVVSATGTRLAVPAGLLAIQNIQITVQTDGNGGVTARYADKTNTTLGPMVYVLNAAGTQVPGLIDAVIQAY